MSSWTKADAGLSRNTFMNIGLKKEGTSSSNRTTLFENNTANTFITGDTHGLFNYTTSETQSGKIAHTGWVLKTTGSGGRAGRYSTTH